MNKTLSECLIERAKEYIKDNPNDYHFALVFDHLTRILNPEEWEEQLQFLYHIWNGEDNNIYKEDEWFEFAFRKTIRQAFLFGNIFRIETPPSTPEIRQEYQGLIEELGTIKANKEISFNELQAIVPEKTKRYLEIKQILEQKKTSVNGHLDMIMWHFTATDNGYTKKVMELAFKYYKHFCN